MSESFYDILVEQITREVRAELEAETNRTPKSFARPTPDLIFFTDIEPRRFSTKKNPYPATPDHPESNPKSKQKDKKTRKLHRPLNVEELLHYNIFLSLGAQLEENFTEQDLKKQFRKLAYQFHPDRQLHLNPSEIKKSAAQFESAKTAYDQLYRTLEK